MYRKKFKYLKQTIALLAAFSTILSPSAGAAAIGNEQFENKSVTEADVTYPSYKEAYDKMIALKEEYTEGMTWTNFTPYGSKGTKGDSYVWKGGKVKGVDRGVGCAAFAFILSDEAFGSLPARAVDKGKFTFKDVKVGDILRVNNNSHFVIVLQKSDAGVIVAEGNYNKSVHWGRVLSKAEVESANFVVTRYPENYVPSDSPEADEVSANGDVTANNVKWSLTKAGKLTISGSGAIPDYTNDNPAPWHEYKDSITTIIIDDGITSIGNYAFDSSKALSVYIPDGITKIGDKAFNSSGLIAVTIPSTVTSIGNDAFHSCANLTSVTVTEGLEDIGEQAFRGCISLAYIDFPGSIKKIGTGAFMSCSKMTQVRFMHGTEDVEIGDNLFTQCWNLKSFTLPKTANRISSGMFQSCTSLSELYIPKSVKEIGELPFASCTNLNTIYFGGTEAEWKSLIGNQMNTSPLNSVKMIYNYEFPDPFAKDPNDPGDLVTHDHIWSQDWLHNEDHHYHKCTVEDCLFESDYEEHKYGDWVIDVDAAVGKEGSRHRECNICNYSQTESIPALVAPSTPSPTNTPSIPTSTPSTPTGTPASTSSTSTSTPGGGSSSNTPSGSSGWTNPGTITPSTATTAPTTATTAPSTATTAPTTATTAPTTATTAPTTATTAPTTATTAPTTATTAPTTATTAPTTATTAPTVTTLPDGTKVEEKIENLDNGTKIETEVDTKTDGSKVETVIETTVDGDVKKTTTETAADGSVLKTENETAKTSDGTSFDLTTTTKIDSSGKVTSVIQKAVIEKADIDTSATITVTKNADGKTTAAKASVSKTTSGKKVSLTGDVIAQIKEVSGEDNLAVTLTVKDDSGKTKFKLKADSNDLQPGNKLYIYQYNSKTGEYIMVKGTALSVTENGSVNVSMSKNATYQLLSPSEATKVNKQILNTVAVKNTSAKIKLGKSTKLILNSKLNKENVKSVKYSVPKNSSVKVSKNGKITAKKTGKTVVKAKVTLKNGMIKTVKMKINVK